MFIKEKIEIISFRNGYNGFVDGIASESAIVIVDRK